jgi:hypothetical protein
LRCCHLSGVLTLAGAAACVLSELGL